MRVYGIMNRKGGVGKTTTAVELAYNLAGYGYRTLLIDADSQGNATSLLLHSTSVCCGLDWILEYGAEGYRDYILETKLLGVSILPATEGLGDYELSCTIGAKKPRFDHIRELMEAIANDDAFDRVVIDFPPYYSVSCIAGLSACDSVIIPAGVDAYSTTGMDGLIRQIDNIRSTCPGIKISGVLVTQYHRADIAEDAIQIITETSPVPIYKTRIRRTDKAVESTWARQPVGQWSPWSAAGRDYRQWVAELLEQEKKEMQCNG